MSGGGYATAAEVLRLLAGGAEPVTLDGNEDPLRGVCRKAAEACEILDAEDQDRRRTRQSVDDIRGLLADVQRYLDDRQALSADGDGVDVDAVMLASRVRQALSGTDWDALKFPGRSLPEEVTADELADELEALDADELDPLLG